jgi:hypothetical protein
LWDNVHIVVHTVQDAKKRVKRGFLPVPCAGRRTRCILISSKHILGKQIPYSAGRPFLAEHLAVIEALLSQEPRRARLAVRVHLESAHAKVDARLQAFRNSYTLTPISFVSPA